MKRRTLLPFLLLLLLALSACEKPLQDTEAIPTVNSNPPGQIIPLPTQILPSPTTVPNDGTGSSTTDGATDPNAGTTNVDPNAGTESATEGDGQSTTPDTDTTTPPDTSTSPSGETFYEIQTGDTLGIIAEKFGVSVEAIMSANGLINEFIYAGDQLRIPVAGSSTSDPTTPSTETSTDASIYTVQRGDTLYRIGLLYGFTVEELATHNGIIDVNSLDIGQQIAIPAR